MRNIEEIIRSVPSREEMESLENQFLPENDWIIIEPGKAIEIIGVRESAPREAIAPSKKSDAEGKYTKNNGKIAFFDSKGRYRIAPATRARIEGLERCGLQEGGATTVLLSNNETPTDPVIANKFSEFMRQAHEEYEQKSATE